MQIMQKIVLFVHFYTVPFEIETLSKFSFTLALNETC